MSRTPALVFLDHDSTRPPAAAIDRERSASALSMRASRAELRSASALSMRASKGDLTILANYVYRKCDQQRWFDEEEDIGMAGFGRHSLGVVMRGADGTSVQEPRTLDRTVVDAADFLGATFLATMGSGAVRALIDQTSLAQNKVVLGRGGLVLHLVTNVAQIFKMGAEALDGHYFLCREERFLLLEADSPHDLLRRGTEIEDMVVGQLWGNSPVGLGPESPVPSLEPAKRSDSSRPSNARPFSEHVLNFLPKSAIQDSAVVEKLAVIQTALEKEQQGDKAFDPEKETQEAPKRKMLLNHAVLVGFAVILCVVVEMACVAKMVSEVRLDGNMMRFALVATIPLFATFSLFFMIVICGSLWQIFGPLSNLKGNSKFYSAVAPKPGRYPDLELPHITIQMPVYKEGLTNVVMPTITSVMAAVRHYESLGGSASIFVNDDGMQLVSKELADARRAYYELHNIGWCARPPHKEPKKAKRGWRKSADEAEVADDGKYFLRKGQFKKASNMNYCLDFSLRVEDEYLSLVAQACQARECTEAELTVKDEDKLYEQARDKIIEADAGRTWAGGDVRLGAIILLIDSDTRVPEDCLLYGALEMHESPEVALIQHASGIMQVVNNVFENGITYFTNLVYNSITFAVGNGDCAPFVGHNTFVRWDALQSISWYDDEDKCTKFWSDSHVSEDFDVSLRLQMQDFVVRLATYHDGDFKEGVSLTVYDELARWEKYAYGCNELVFNPLYQWLYRGPFTRLFLRFVFSNIKVSSKITIFAYIGTYYAVASAIPLSVANYLLVGWLDGNIDQFYLTSWRVFVGMAVVFNVLSPLGYAMLRHRLGKATFFLSLWDTIKWTPMFLLFFGGVSFHLLKAITCHFLSIKMEWTTTAKEYNGGFRIGLDRIVRDFKWMYLVLVVMTGGMIYLGCFAPYGWTITDFSAIVPLANQVGCHALLPFALGLF